MQRIALPVLILAFGCSESALPSGGGEVPTPDVAAGIDTHPTTDIGAKDAAVDTATEPDVADASEPENDIADTSGAEDTCPGCVPDTGPVCPDPPDCNDHDKCTKDEAVGPTVTCAWHCEHTPIPKCCGNGITEDGETCDGDCPVCNDGNPCTTDITKGSADTCDVVCESVPGDTTTDSDGDGRPDCEEATDDLPFTDPAVFNGLLATIGEPPYGVLSSAQCDIFFGDDYGQMLMLFDESNQSQPVWSGWEYAAGNTNDYNDPNEFDFQPNWDNDDNGGVYNSFQVWFTGRFYAAEAGTYCFSVDTGSGGFGPGDIAGRRNCCGRVYVNPESTSLPLAETGYGADKSPVTGCVAMDAGANRIDIAARHYETYFYAPKLSVRTCFGGAEPCTPDQPLTTDRLQVP